MSHSDAALQARPLGRPGAELREGAGVTLTVLVVTGRASARGNRFLRRVQDAYLARLGADARVRLVVAADAAELPRLVEEAPPAFLLNLSAHDVEEFQRLLPPDTLLVDFQYREGDAVQVPLSRLARRPLYLPGIRAVLQHPSMVTLGAFLYRGAERLGTIGQWEGRSHHKVAGRIARALPGASYLVIDCFVGALHEGVAAEQYGPLRAVPEPSCRLPTERKPVLLVRYLQHLVRRTVRLRLAPDLVPQWSLGVARVGTGEMMPTTPDAVTWLRPPADRFFADPFLLAHRGRRVVLFEEKRFEEAHGAIMAAPVGDDGVVRIAERVPALRTDHHLSFPFAFTHDGEAYLLPEQASSWRVVLYRSTRFPTHWEPWAVLLEGFQGADPVLHHHEGHWYLFVSDATHGNHDNHLQLFVAPTLAGPYRRHPGSPVRFGLRGSRMAGALEQTDQGLLRYGQECHEQYGGSISVFQVEALSPTTYRERFLRRLPPMPGVFSMAMHTRSRMDGLLALDGLRPMPRVPRGAP